MRNVLLYEPMDEAGIQYLGAHNCELVFAKSLGEEWLIQAVKDIDAIIIRANGSVSSKLMDAAPGLRVIGRHGVGVESIDLDAAAERGIYVVNTPDANTEAVAETTMGLMLAAAKRICEANQSLRSGNWDARYSLIGTDLAGKTLGVIGFGRIGRRIAQIAHGGFRMKITFYDVAEIESEFEQVELVELLARADFVSVNLPLTPQTKGLLSRERLQQAKKGCCLVNTSRGNIVDEQAVSDLVDQEHFLGGAFDVYSKEPASPNNPVIRNPRIVTLPHMAAHSREAMMAMSMVAKDVVRVLDGQLPIYPVISPNKPKRA